MIARALFWFHSGLAVIALVIAAWCLKEGNNIGVASNLVTAATNLGMAIHWYRWTAI